MRVLQVYRMDTGRWAGVMIFDGNEIGRVAGCASPEEVETAAAETWCEIEHVDLKHTGADESELGTMATAR